MPLDTFGNWNVASSQFIVTEVTKMTRHPDYEKILQAFIKHYGEKEGTTLYQTWLSKMNLDDTKPYEQLKEKFSWIKDRIQFYKEDEKAKYFKVRALFPLTSMNNNLYTTHEIMTASKTLIGKPTDLNHTSEVLSEVQTVDADFETDTVECLDRVEKGSKALQLLESNQIINVSIEADCLRGSRPTPEGNLCMGLVFTGKAYLTKDVLPGVPLTTIEPVEKIVERFTVTKMDKTEGSTKTETETATAIGKTEAKAYDEFRKELDALKQRLADLESKMTAAPETEDVEVYVDNLSLEREGWGDSSFPDSCFAYVPDSAKGVDGNKSDRKLPYKDKDGTVSLSHVRNGLARLDQTQGIPDAEKTRIRTLLQNILKKANPDYTAPETKQPETPTETKKPEVQEQKKQCLCVLTEAGKWARFHQLRSEGLDKTDAFRLLCQEMQEAAMKKVGHETSPRDKP